MSQYFFLPVLDQLEVYQSGTSSFEFPNHYHETYCISLVQSGIYVENGHIAPTGSIVISLPHEIHQNTIFNQCTYSLLTYYVNPDVLLYSHQQSNRKNILFKQKVIQNAHLFQYLSLFSERYLPKQDASIPTFSKHIEQQFLQFLTTLCHQQTCSDVKSSYPHISISDNINLQTIKTYIHTHLDHKIALINLAKILDMSKYQFIRWFKKMVGLSPFDYIILNRVTKGKKLLAQRVPICQAAFDVGFYDQSHFTKYFKRFLGITPGTYQQHCNILQDKNIFPTDLCTHIPT